VGVDRKRDVQSGQGRAPVVQCLECTQRARDPMGIAPGIGTGDGDGRGELKSLPAGDDVHWGASTRVGGSLRWSRFSRGLGKSVREGRETGNLPGTKDAGEGAARGANEGRGTKARGSSTCEVAGWQEERVRREARAGVGGGG
jgi:hypothetical protein